MVNCDLLRVGVEHSSKHPSHYQGVDLDIFAVRDVVAEVSGIQDSEDAATCCVDLLETFLVDNPHFCFQSELLAETVDSDLSDFHRCHKDPMGTVTHWEQNVRHRVWCIVIQRPTASECSP